MITQQENDLLTRTDKGTPAGEMIRRYWQPVALGEELPQGGAPLAVHVECDAPGAWRQMLWYDRRLMPGGTRLDFDRIRPTTLRWVVVHLIEETARALLRKLRRRWCAEALRKYSGDNPEWIVRTPPAPICAAMPDARAISQLFGVWPLMCVCTVQPLAQYRARCNTRPALPDILMYSLLSGARGSTLRTSHGTPWLRRIARAFHT